MYVKVKGAGGRDVYARASDAAKYGLDASGRETYYKVEDPSDPTKPFTSPRRRSKEWRHEDRPCSVGRRPGPERRRLLPQVRQSYWQRREDRCQDSAARNHGRPGTAKALTGADEIGGDEKPTAKAPPEGAASPNREAAASASKDTPPSIPEFGGAGKLVGHDERGRGLYLFPDGKKRAWNKPKS